MEVRWSLPAAEDLEHICAWIERDNPEAARRVARTIYDECGRLKDFPNLGRASRRMAGVASLHSRLYLTSWYIRSRRTQLKSRASSTVRKTGREAQSCFHFGVDGLIQLEACLGRGSNFYEL